MLFSCIQKPNVSNLLHFGLILAFQRSNEMYKTIRTNHPRTYNVAPYSKNTYFTHLLISFIFAIDLVLWTSTLILLSGDVEVNPCPDSVDSNTNSNHNISTSSLEMLSNHQFIIQSIIPKMDIIRSEADAYDVPLFTESWLKPDISDTTVYIENFSQPFRNDRRNRLGGGVLAYVRESITYKRRHDLEINGLEDVLTRTFCQNEKSTRGRYIPTTK